jgi:hypothetical protein
VTPQLVIGSVVLLLGVAFLLNNLGYPEVTGYLKYWPAALVAIGAAKAIQARSVAGAVGGSAWLLLGAWLLLNNLGYVDISFWRALKTYWPVILIALGLSTVWRTIRRQVSPPSAADTRSVLNVVALLGGLKRRSVTPDFRGGEMTAFMGGVDLDLSGATLRGEAAIDAFAMWGGIDLRVPDGWHIEGRVFPFLGGFEDKTRPVAGQDGPRLIIRGVAIMGGISVKN